jgi:hypothetical protein
METEKVVFHFWASDSQGQTTLYEVEYYRYPNRVGVPRYAKVFASERPCACPEKAIHERRRAAVRNWRPRDHARLGGETMETPPFHRAPTHHTITCSGCQDTIRVPTRRRFLCDNCFYTGPSRKSEQYWPAFGRKRTDWLVQNRLRGDEEIRSEWNARRRDLPSSEKEDSRLSAYLRYASREQVGKGA